MNDTEHVGYDPNWQEKYKDMVVTAEKAVAHINPGQRIFISTGCAQPEALVQALTARSGPYPSLDLCLIQIPPGSVFAAPLWPNLLLG